MSKHTIGKSRSFGTRISCKGNVKVAKQAIIVPLHTETAMREAFKNVVFGHVSKVRTMIIDAVESKRNVGTSRCGRGWTANVSNSTLKTLTAQGVFG